MKYFFKKAAILWRERKNRNCRQKRRRIERALRKIREANYEGRIHSRTLPEPVGDNRDNYQYTTSTADCDMGMETRVCSYLPAHELRTVQSFCEDTGGSLYGRRFEVTGTL